MNQSYARIVGNKYKAGVLNLKQIIKVIRIVCLSALYALLLVLMIGVVSIKYVNVCGERYYSTAEKLTISDSDFLKYDDYSFMSDFRNLKTLDISSLAITPEKYDAISSALDKDTKVIWSLPYRGEMVPCDIESLTITTDLEEEDLQSLAYFNNLKNVDVDGIFPIKKLYQIITTIKKGNSNLPLTYSTKLYGIKIDTSTEAVILNNKKIKQTDDLKMAIELFPNIKKYEMCDCGLSDDTMGQLREDYPDVTFVWMLHLLKYNVRTDAQAFSTLISKWVGQIDENTFAPLFKYCTELRALDLGHCDFTDISGVANLKHLIALILGDNHITDISPLAELHDLVFVDLNLNRIKDVTPLLGLENLEVIGLGTNPLKNAEKLAERDNSKLRLILLQKCALTTKTLDKIKASLPSDCQYIIRSDEGYRWFYGDYCRILRGQHFPKWKSIKEYHSIKDVVWYDVKPYAKDDIEQLWKTIYGE